MNLYEFSQVNNEEMGVLVTKSGDATLYASVYEEAMRLIRISEEIRVTVEKVTPNPPSPVSQVDMPEKGYCIRCRKSLAANPMYPYCEEHFESWRRYNNPDYEEKWCHLCGKESKSTKRKPTDYSCYKKYSGVLTFPAG
jgi:hypothetical protein